MTRNIPLSERELLFGLSAAFCAFPGCRARLVADAKLVDSTKLLAEIAHIVGYSDTGPRADPGMPAKERNRYSNLVLLCAHHHTLVDKQPNSYTSSDLHQWKTDLEAWCDERLSEGSSEFQFAELIVICDALIAGTLAISSTPLLVAPPAVKMVHNELTGRVGYQMQLGLMQADQVQQFLAEYAGRLDPTFPGRLRSRFLDKYEELRLSGLKGDALFFALMNFATNSAVDASADTNTRFTYRAAGLAVLCHLFEICDIFEVPSQ